MVRRFSSRLLIVLLLGGVLAAMLIELTRPQPPVAVGRPVPGVVTSGGSSVSSPLAPQPTPTPIARTTAPSGTAAPSSTAAPAGTSGPRPAAGVGSGWKQVWADEFSGTSIDRSRWNVRDGEGRDVDLGCNVASRRNAFQGDGVLVIRALRESVRCGSRTRSYSEAYLDTIGKASFTYGCFEMRAKSPTVPNGSTGLWPAFWLRPDDGGKGEIDVVELPGGAAYHGAATQAIFYDYSPIKQDNRHTVRTGHPADGFHTYTTEWAPGELRWYIDGVRVYQRDRRTTPWFDEAFSRPFNLRLNLQVGGWLGDPDSSTVFPADFVVDYIRVWQR
jgi:beta-glucanase (GH16 family)